MNIVIIKYNAGNIESVNNALNRLGVNAEITADRDKIQNADNRITSYNVCYTKLLRICCNWV